MQEELLNSVVKITKTRDIDSLEYSLASTIHEFIHCQKIAVYKDLQIPDKLVVERSVALEEVSDKEFEWYERSIISEPDNELISCLQSACTITVQSVDGIERRWVPISIQERPVAAIAIVSKQMSSGDQVLLNAFCRIFENYLTILHENERDKLTGLLNRHTFDRRLKQLIERQVVKKHKSVRSADVRKLHNDATSWLAVIDIDHFKQVNDKYGHVCGDEVLLLLAQQMKKFFRSNDLVFRYGGEEFVLVFEPTHFDAMNNRMKEFMELLKNTKFPFVNNLTVSIGMARISPYDFPITVIEKADKALYFAKEHGRNQVRFYEQLLADGEIIEPDVEDSDIDLF
ncbi:GGDEF domain-containing protein [Pseudoalteromonas sp. T1lg65]|uniref:GGDEF domain-containing protein n=1 Tax=Pseudoalteromonas sp. T1lg65 TaxID=2077101 RepID=UPI003F794CF7